MNETIRTNFLSAAEAWVCDDYALDVRFLAHANGDEYQIWNAAVALNPLRAEQDNSFQIETNGLLLGQIQTFSVKKKSLLELLSRAAEGGLALSGKRLVLPGGPSFDLYTETWHKDRLFSPLHLRVGGSRTWALPYTQSVVLDNALRKAEIPFDGLSDAAGWLDLAPPHISSNSPSLNLYVGPPVNLVFGESLLADGLFQATLHAHPKFDVDGIGLAVRAVPGVGLAARRQIAGHIKWKRVKEGRRVGTVTVNLDHADSVLAILMIGTSTVSRQWFLDPAKARNNRYLALQHFDKDLRMVKQGLFEAPDQAKFELGVAALLFLLGFTPVVALETDSPDLVVTTPGGRLVVVECTTKISDFASKLGKLVHRRGALSEALGASGHPDQVSAALVCRLPRDQIAAQSHELVAQGILLLTREDLESGLERLRFPNNPDRMLDEATQHLSAGALGLLHERHEI